LLGDEYKIRPHKDMHEILWCKVRRQAEAHKLKELRAAQKAAMSEQNRGISPMTPTTEHREGDVTLGSSIPFAKEAPPNQLALLGPSTPSPAPASRQNTPSRILYFGTDNTTPSRHTSSPFLHTTSSAAHLVNPTTFTPRTFTVHIPRSQQDAKFRAIDIVPASKRDEFAVEDMYLEEFWAEVERQTGVKRGGKKLSGHVPHMDGDGAMGYTWMDATDERRWRAMLQECCVVGEKGCEFLVVDA
jgi:hypothetical protein